MSGSNEDDKATVVLDLNALKKQKMKQEEDLANIGHELVFNVGKDEDGALPVDEEFLMEQVQEEATETEEVKAEFPIIFFDLQSDFFNKNMNLLPRGYNYKIISTLEELNQTLKSKSFQILVLNYDVNPKAVNQVAAQVKTKFPFTKTMILAKAISPEKAKLHMKTASGANGYYQLPLEASRFEKEIEKIKSRG
jgi:hypothetical protein